MVLKCIGVYGLEMMMYWVDVGSDSDENNRINKASLKSTNKAFMNCWRTVGVLWK